MISPDLFLGIPIIGTFHMCNSTTVPMDDQCGCYNVWVVIHGVFKSFGTFQVVLT